MPQILPGKYRCPCCRRVGRVLLDDEHRRPKGKSRNVKARQRSPGGGCLDVSSRSGRQRHRAEGIGGNTLTGPAKYGGTPAHQPSSWRSTRGRPLQDKQQSPSSSYTDEDYCSCSSGDCSSLSSSRSGSQCYSGSCSEEECGGRCFNKRFNKNKFDSGGRYIEDDDDDQHSYSTVASDRYRSSRRQRHRPDLITHNKKPTWASHRYIQSASMPQNSQQRRDVTHNQKSSYRYIRSQNFDRNIEVQLPPLRNLKVRSSRVAESLTPAAIRSASQPQRQQQPLPLPLPLSRVKGASNFVRKNHSKVPPPYSKLDFYEIPRYLGLKHPQDPSLIRQSKKSYDSLRRNDKKPEAPPILLRPQGAHLRSKSSAASPYKTLPFTGGSSPKYRAGDVPQRRMEYRMLMANHNDSVKNLKGGWQTDTGCHDNTDSRRTWDEGCFRPEKPHRMVPHRDCIASYVEDMQPLCAVAQCIGVAACAPVKLGCEVLGGIVDGCTRISSKNDATYSQQQLKQGKRRGDHLQCQSINPSASTPCYPQTQQRFIVSSENGQMAIQPTVQGFLAPAGAKGPINIQPPSPGKGGGTSCAYCSNESCPPTCVGHQEGGLTNAVSRGGSIGLPATVIHYD